MSRPTSPNWRDRVVSEVESKVRSTRRNRNRRLYASRIDIDIPYGSLLGMLTEVAARREVSPTGYVRRAMLAFIAYDLGLPFAEVVKADPRFTPPGSNRPVDDPTGELGGPWEIR